MQAAVYKPGSPQLHIVNDFPIPKPGPDQVLLKVQASGLCHSDVWFLSQFADDKRTYIMGHECTGIAIDFGANVKNIEKNKRYVVLVNGGGCASCAGKQQMQSKLQGGGNSTNSASPIPTPPDSSPYAEFFMIPAFGIGVNGGHAEYAVQDASLLVPVPDDVVPEHACLAGDSGITAWHAVKTEANIKKGEKVLITGIGGLGLQAVQMAKYLGAEVYAVDMRPGSRELALKHGATKAFDLPQLDAEITKGFTVDCAIDFVSTDTTFTREVQAVQLTYNNSGLRKNGRIVIVGLSDQNLVLNVVPGIFLPISVIFSQYGTREDAIEVLKLIKEGHVKPVVEKIPLAKVNKGYNVLRAKLVPSRAIAVPPAFWRDE